MNNIAQENADVVHRGYAAFNKGDMATLTELFHENATWHCPGKSPRAGDFIGRDAAFEQFGHYGGDTGGTFKAELQNVYTTEDGKVIGVHHNTAAMNGKQLDVWCCLSFEVKDGKILSGREHFYDLYAWDAFWS